MSWYKRLSIQEMARAVPEHGLLDLHQVYHRREPYLSHLEKLPLKYQLQLFLAFFQMAGYNRYDRTSYVEVLEAIDGGTLTTLEVNATRLTERKAVLDTVRKNATAADLLHVVGKGWLPALEADLPLEYMPFATMVFASPFTCDVVLGDDLRASSRGIYVASPSRKVQASTARRRLPLAPRARLPRAHHGAPESHEHDHGHGHGHDSTAAASATSTCRPSSRAIGSVMCSRAIASLLKVPSRVTTYLELFLGSDHAAAAHVAPLIAGVEPIVRTVGARGARRLHRYSFTASVAGPRRRRRNV